jgi:hypothetical protein
VVGIRSVQLFIFALNQVVHTCRILDDVEITFLLHKRSMHGKSKHSPCEG